MIGSFVLHSAVPYFYSLDHGHFTTTYYSNNACRVGFAINDIWYGVKFSSPFYDFGVFPTTANGVVLPSDFFITQLPLALKACIDYLNTVPLDYSVFPFSDFSLFPPDYSKIGLYSWVSLQYNCIGYNSTSCCGC